MAYMSSGDDLPSLRLPTNGELDSIAGGDESVIGALLHRWMPTIDSMIRRYASQPAELDELRQEGLLAIHSAALRFNRAGAVPFDHYARRAIRNRCLNFVARRRLDAQQIAAAIEIASGIQRPGRDGDVLDSLEREETALVVDRVIAGAPGRLQEVFELMYVQGQSQRQAAKHLGVSQPRVARLHRGLLDWGRTTLQFSAN